MTAGKSFKDIIDACLKSESIELPIFDKIAMKIQEEAARAEPNIRTIVELIETDTALTGQVIKVANTAFFRGMARVETVRDAVIRLGTKQLYSIVVLVTQKNNYRSKDAFIQKYMAPLWRHSVAVAVGAGWLASRCGYAQQKEQAFTAGLLHDVGKIFLLTVVEAIRSDPKLSFNPTPALMSQIMQTLHAEQGYKLLEQWNLPETYSIVARDHHTELMESSDVLLLLVQMANIACNKMGIGMKGISDLILAATVPAQILTLSELDLAELEIALEDSAVFME
jgi:putative nucleotidyltransferase with HDIG domain